MFNAGYFLSLFAGTGQVDGEKMLPDYKPIYTTHAKATAGLSKSKNEAVEQELLSTLDMMNFKIGDMTTAAPMDDHEYSAAERERLKHTDIVQPLQVVQSKDMIFPT